MFVNEVTVGNRLVFGDPSHSQRPASPFPDLMAAAIRHEDIGGWAATNLS